MTMTSPQQRRANTSTQATTSPTSTIGKIHSTQILAEVRDFDTE